MTLRRRSWQWFGGSLGGVALLASFGVSACGGDDSVVGSSSGATSSSGGWSTYVGASSSAETSAATPTGSSDGDAADTGDDAGAARCETDASNLVVNGSFESPVVTRPAQRDLHPSERLPGWDVQWGYTGPCDVDDPVQSPAVGLQKNLHAVAVNGIQYAELDASCHGLDVDASAHETTSARLAQNIDTSAAERYELRFWARQRPGAEGTQRLTVIFANQLLLVGAPVPATWGEFVFQVEAPERVSELLLEDVGAPDSLGVLLDDVRVFALDSDCDAPGE